MPWGKLVLWQNNTDTVISDESLTHSTFRHLAIANPRLAPYGIATQQALQALSLWNDLKNRLVRGENIAQTFQFVSSGNAELGFIAYSQVKQLDKDDSGSYWLVPQSLYSPIRQQAILLKENITARAFLSFMRTKNVLKIIRDSGYDTP